MTPYTIMLPLLIFSTMAGFFLGILFAYADLKTPQYQVIAIQHHAAHWEADKGGLPEFHWNNEGDSK